MENNKEYIPMALGIFPSPKGIGYALQGYDEDGRVATSRFVNIRAKDMERYRSKLIRLIERHNPDIVITRGETTFRSGYLNAAMYSLKEWLHDKGIPLRIITRREMKDRFRHLERPSRVGIAKYIRQNHPDFAGLPELTASKQTQGCTPLTFRYDAIALLMVWEGDNSFK